MTTAVSIILLRAVPVVLRRSMPTSPMRARGMRICPVPGNVRQLRVRQIKRRVLLSDLRGTQEEHVPP